MKSMQLIKLVKSVNATKLNPFSYEYEHHCLRGIKERSIIKDVVKSKIYGKDLKMTGRKNHAVKYLNTWSWVIISEAKYNELLFRYNSEA